MSDDFRPTASWQNLRRDNNARIVAARPGPGQTLAADTIFAGVGENVFNLLLGDVVVVNVRAAGPRVDVIPDVDRAQSRRSFERSMGHSPVS